ncbi:Pre-mRNA-splicing factor SLU7, partial [Fragariocoptes setiger]
MSTPTLPVSALVRSKNKQDDASEQQTKRSRQEDYKRAKELEEARKAGDAPAAVDEEGRDINPHIPQYISSVPWFYNTAQPTLRHQRVLKQKKERIPLDLDVVRGVKVQTANKYRKGACENCGAITHKKKDCLERPRKIGAKYTNDNIAPDEVLIPDLDHDFDSKRDRWAGFKPEMYKPVIDEYLKVDEAKRQLKEEKLRQEAEMAKNAPDPEAGPSDDTTGKTTENPIDSDDSDDEEDKYADKADMPGTKVDSKQRITVRNLRIREDTAKYLRNLDLDSAYYDPKTRAMRENPYDDVRDPSELPYAGENFVRYTGDVNKVYKAQVFAWQAAEKGIDIHMQALPTKAEAVLKEFDVKQEAHKQEVKKYITEKYGAPESSQAPPRNLLLEQSEHYVEYSRTGQVLKGPMLGPGRLLAYDDDDDANANYRRDDRHENEQEKNEDGNDDDTAGHSGSGSKSTDW